MRLRAMIDAPAARIRLILAVALLGMGACPTIAGAESSQVSVGPIQTLAHVPYPGNPGAATIDGNTMWVDSSGVYDRAFDGYSAVFAYDLNTGQLQSRRPNPITVSKPPVAAMGLAGIALDAAGRLYIADMNAKAGRLGLRTTHFLNPTGLDASGHYSSADDLATATIFLESHYPGLVGIAATPAITVAATATHKAYTLVNLDKLLRTYPGTYGLKTGWTEQALGCLITTSSRGGHRLLGVMLGAPNGTAYAQMPKLLDYGFELLGVLPRPATS